MTCNRLDNLLDDYIDGALDDKVADEVSAHVESCADCEKAVARARELQGLLREYGDSSMPTPEATFYDEALVQAARAGRSGAGSGARCNYGCHLSGMSSTMRSLPRAIHASEAPPSASPYPTTSRNYINAGLNDATSGRFFTGN